MLINLQTISYTKSLKHTFENTDTRGISQVIT